MQAGSLVLVHQRHRLRLALSLLLTIGVVGWLLSFPQVLPRTPTQAAEPLTFDPLIRIVDHQPSWRDTLLLDVTIEDPGMQRRFGSLDWQSGDRGQGTIPVEILANGQPQRLVIPVGIHSAWQDNPRDIRLSLAAPVMVLVQVHHVEVVTRPVCALDAWLGKFLLPLLAVVPPFTNLAMLTAAVLCGALAIALPWADWYRRMIAWGWILGGTFALMTVTSLVVLLSQLFPLYNGLSEAEAAGRVTSYTEQSIVAQELIAAAPGIPDAPVMILDDDQESFLVYRARYLFYPRRVDTTIATRSASRLAEVLAKGGYGTVLQIGGRSHLPVPGWRQHSDQGDTVSIWVNPRIAPPAAAAPDKPWALPRLLVALLGVTLVGLACAYGVGLRGALLWVSAWPIGTMLLAWWMALLDVIELPWTWWSIGLPLGLVSVFVLVRSRPSPLQPTNLLPTLRQGWAREISGGIVLLLMLAASIAQASLLPFTDQDTWKMWALKAYGFAHDGRIAPVLTLYPDSDIHHAAYPPAQPLLLAWGYLSMGGVSERLVKLIFPIWYLACVLLIWASCRQWGLRAGAVGWALLLATTPIMLDHATLGNADLPLATLWALGAIALVQWQDSEQPRWLWFGTLVLSGAAWLKVDGQAIGVGMLLAAVLVRLFSLTRRRQRLGATLALGGAALVVFLLSLVPWAVATRSLGLVDPTPGTNVLSARGLHVVGDGLQVMVTELLLSHNNSARGLLGGGYGALWILAFGATLIGWRAFQHDPGAWLLGLIVVGTLVAYVGIYALRPYSSIDRYVLHVAPIAVLLAARVALSYPPIFKASKGLNVL